MKVHSEEHWQKMVEDLTKDGEAGQMFLKCVERWVDLTEEILKRHSDHSTAEALWQAVSPLEEEVGVIPTHWLTQFLAVILLHWEKGEEVSARLSPLEMKVVEDCFEAKLSALQKQAAEQSS